MTLHFHVVPRPGESMPFHLESLWRLTASPQSVWNAFNRVDDWASWWPGIAAAEAAPGTAGTCAKVHVRSPLGHGLAVTLSLREVAPPHSAQVDVTGDLRGTGTWRARAASGGTRVDFAWCVVTGSRLIRALRPLGAPAHRRVMAAGETGLNARLHDT